LYAFWFPKQRRRHSYFAFILIKDDLTPANRPCGLGIYNGETGMHFFLLIVFFGAVVDSIVVLLIVEMTAPTQ
jgi:hypothetical protein